MNSIKLFNIALKRTLASNLHRVITKFKRKKRTSFDHECFLYCNVARIGEVISSNLAHQPQFRQVDVGDSVAIMFLFISRVTLPSLLKS